MLALLVAMAVAVTAVALPAQAQYSPPPAGTPRAGTTVAGGQPSEILPQQSTLSQWITYDYGDFGPVGDGIPVMSEVFLRSGFSIPTSAGPASNLGQTLGLGWEIEGGGKLLFFNPTVDAAWTIWASISNAANRGASNRTYRITDFLVINDPLIPPPYAPVTLDVRVNSSNRTFVNLGLGREWYLYGSANSPDNRLRVGVDGGGRWGSGRVEIVGVNVVNNPSGSNNIILRHRTDVIGSVFAALYADYAIPVGACTILAGLRGEWDYNWSDILQGANDIMSINALVTLGLLF